ncbi:hypothetical protein AGDE_02585 [Angomonas deanei]|nr:hypothetical protein AGDE_02585 [Angomonas deanei]|eukprot:EPY41340.1 hypothetical protein AGDE_02585 [Angomonas deanei]
MKALHYADMTEDFLQQVQTATGDGVDWEGLFNFTRYHVSAKNGTEMVKQGQQTVFRVNCLDCLDRTNLLQSQIGHIMLDHMIAYVTDAGEATIRQRKDPHQDSAHRALNFLFAQQGHALSYLYTNVTFHFQYYLLYGKKNNPWDMLWAAFISGMRFIHQNFFDGRKQDAVSVVTGQHAPSTF